MPSFGLIGAAGFVAPRHMQAIKAIGGEIKAAFDPHDSVGAIDEYFPDASFFVEFERFERHLDELRRRGEKLDWISVCSPTPTSSARSPWFSTRGIWMALPRLKRRRAGAFLPCCSFGFTRRSRR